MSENTSKKTFALSAAGISALLVAAFALLSGGDITSIRTTLGAGTSSYSDPTTTIGDLVTRGDAGVTRIAIGADASVLTSVAGRAQWAAPASSSPTTTRGDLIRRGASADERLALGTSGYVLTAGATDPAWAAPAVTASQITDSTSTGRSLLTAATAKDARDALGTATTGVDTSRPTAAASLIGQVYTATDTGASYRCESDGAGGTRWRNVASNELDNVALNCTSSARQHISETTHAPIQTGTIVVFFGTVSRPGSVAAMLGNFSGGGWQLEMGNNAGDRGLLSLYRGGLSITRQELTGATVTGSLSTLHAIAIAVTNASIRWSFDGGAVQTGSATTGTATGTAAWWVCGGAVTQLYQAVRVVAEEASDADLVTLSDATARAAHRIPAVSSAPTILLDWHASRIPSGSLGSVISGAQADRAYSATGTRLVTL